MLDPTHPHLTRRQRDIIAMSSEGLTDREIAEILDIRPKTVKVHKQHALRRLRARNTAHAVAILLREGEIL